MGCARAQRRTHLRLGSCSSSSTSRKIKKYADGERVEIVRVLPSSCGSSNRRLSNLASFACSIATAVSASTHASAAGA
eukprot:2970154-Prymnesium_polylepis.1